MIRYTTVFLLSFFLCILTGGVLCETAKAADTADFLRAQELYRKGDVGEAAIIFFNLKHSNELIAQQRNLAAEQFNSCITTLRTNPAQTDVFGSLISQQKDNQRMRVLSYQYASLLESQRRYQDLVEVHRQLYKLSPTDNQKYTLARKLDKAGSHQEAYDLYTDLLSSQQYHETVLRHMLETVHQLDNSDTYFDAFFAAQKEKIINNYNLFNVMIATLIKLKRYQQALAYSFVMADKYPHLTDALAYKLTALYKEGLLSDADLQKMIRRSKKPPTAQQRFLIAKIYGSAGDTDAAIKMLGTDTSKDVVGYRAFLYMRAENYDLARKMYQSLIDKHTARPQWYQRLAEIAFKTGKDDQAIDALEKYLAFQENTNFNSYFLVAKMFERYGLTQQAEQMYLEGKQIARNEKYPAIELIKYYINQKDYQQAAVEIVESQKGAIVQPSQLYSYLQNTFRDQTMVTQVIDQVEHQLTLQQGQLTDQQRSDLYYCLYVFASQIGDYDRSIPFFTAFFTLSPNKYDELMQFVAKLEDAGFYREASALLDLLPIDSPIFTKSVQKRAQLLIKQGSPKEALQLLQTYPQARNDYLYARALVETGNPSAGLHVLRSMSNSSPPCTLLEARIAMLNRNFEEAAEIYATVDKSAGSNYIRALYGAGLAHLFNSSFENALEKFEEVCHLYAHSPEARDAIALRALIALISATGNEQLIDQWVNAEFFLWADNTTGAITGFENVLSLNNDAPYVQDIRMRLFRLYASDTQYDRALSQLDSIVEDNPSSALGAWAMHMKIELQEKINGGQLNQDDFAQLLESYPDSYDADIIRRELEKKRTEQTLSPAM